ncbi:MAG: ABC transporter ATP-binding protein/permease [Clostridia bacterium]|nr:ABC transporter ATP-binding protein/permease [Clostridia bacterium]
MIKKWITDRRDIYKVIEPYISKFTKQILALGAIKILVVVTGMATPYLFKLLIDDVMIEKDLSILKWICVGYITLYFLEAALLSLQKVIGNRLFNKLTFDIRFKVWTNYLKMPANIYSDYNVGDLKNRIDSDINAYENFLGQQIIEYISSWIMTVSIGIVVAMINWKLALVGFVMVPVSFWMTKRFGSGIRKSSEAVRNTWGRYESYLQNSIQGWKEVKALTIEKRVIRTFTAYWHSFSKHFFTMQMCICGNRNFIAIKDIFVTKMNLYFIGGFLIINGELTIGALLVFMQYYEKFTNTIGNINNLDIQLSSDIPALMRVQEILKQPENICNPVPKGVEFKGEIEFCNVDFKYSRSESETLKGINLRIRPQERIAVVGRSGSGKSTLIKLILGLYAPQNGAVLIDGKDIQGMNSRCLHRNIGVVMQDSILFNMTIRENLLMAKPTATDEEIREACRMAYIDEFIETLPDGYMTMVGEKGVRLSGGQKQRIAIARALLSKPSIIIFDEATSSLDYESEKMIHKAIENIAKGRTVITIAHRLSSILSSDRVLVVDGGKIVEEGHHKELYGAGRVYDQLFKEQYDRVS